MYAADFARSLAEAGHIGEVATVGTDAVAVVCNGAGPVAGVSLEAEGEEGEEGEEMAAFTLAFTAGTAGLEEDEGVEEEPG